MEAFAENFPVNTLIDQVADTAQALMAKNNNHFKVERGDNLGEAWQDVTKLQQTLLNLLSNAAKFTHDGIITLKVELESGGPEDWLILTVRDTGIGIRADKLDHVFEEFSQADGSTTRDYGGTGLGLAISQRFCRMLGGDLTVISQIGEGSTFSIRVPAVLPETLVVQDDSMQPTVTDKNETGDRHTVEQGDTVLVIDDDIEACEIIERYLSKDGFNIVTATSGEEGLRLAHKLQPVAITLDVVMPDMDGWSVLRALKVDPVLHTIPVVMLTMIDDQTKAYSLGATDYITKPVDRARLRSTLTRYHTQGARSLALLVEDDQATREVMLRTLERASWRVKEAGNGREGLQQLAQETPQVILLDLMMPVMDGFDFLLEMRANAAWQDIPVIVLTAKDLTEEDRRVLSGRVEQIVEKGASSNENVLNLVSKLVSRS
jgi:CheY-like chemotaxis protein